MKKKEINVEEKNEHQRLKQLLSPLQLVPTQSGREKIVCLKKQIPFVPELSMTCKIMLGLH